MIDLVDEFVLYDSVQYTRRDWRNRNRIKTPHGLKWMTIPVSADYEDKIQDVKIADDNWTKKHWGTIKQFLGKASHFEVYSEKVKRLYEQAESETYLSDINLLFLQGLKEILKIETPLFKSSEFEFEGDKSCRLLSICKQANADVYVSGPAAKSYLDVKLFKEKGVEVEWMDYSGYDEYDQLFGKFEPSVSVLDLIFNLGENAEKFVKTHKVELAEVSV